MKRHHKIRKMRCLRPERKRSHRSKRISIEHRQSVQFVEVRRSS